MSSFFFSWQSHSEWSTFLTICSSFIFVHLPSSTKPGSVGSILALNHKFLMLPKVQVRPKGPPFGFFSALCGFFRKFSNFIKGYPLAFCQRERITQNNPKFWDFAIFTCLFQSFQLLKQSHQNSEFHKFCASKRCYCQVFQVTNVMLLKGKPVLTLQNQSF